MPNAGIEAVKRFAEQYDIRRRHVVLAVLLLVLGVGLAYVLRPSVQREFALAKLGPLVESLTIDHVQITPWSAELRGVDVGHGGGRYHIGALTLGFNPLALIARTLSIRHLALTDTVLDLRGVEPGAPSNAAFPGVLASVNQGYALRLGTLDAKLVVLMKDKQKLDLSLNGAEFAPLRVGTLNYALRFTPPAGQAPVTAEGSINITQINRGRVSTLDAQLVTALPLAAPGVAQRLQMDLEVTPHETEEIRPAPRTVKQPDGSLLVLPEPEDFALTFKVGNEHEARFELNGRYRGEDGFFSGHYRLAEIAGMLKTIVGDTPLPDIETDTHGHLELDSVHLRGKLTLESDTRATALERVLGASATLPEHLDLHAEAHGSFDAAQFTLANFALTLADAEPTQRLQLALGAPLSIPFLAPLTLLDTPREVARVAIGPLPLAWLDGLAKTYGLSGELLGPFAVLIDADKRLEFEPLAPTRVTGVRVVEVSATTPADANAGADAKPATTPETVLIDDLSLSLKPSASWSPDFLRFALNEAELRVGATALAEFDVKAASKRSDAPDPTWRLRTSASLHYDGLGAVPAAAARRKDYPLPAGLSLSLKSLITQHAQALSIEKAEVNVSGPDHPDLLRASALQPLHVTLGETPALNNPQGALATLATRGIDLTWLNPFLQGLTLSGRIASADFKLDAPSAGTLALTAAGPLAIEHFGVTRDGTALLQGLVIRALPDLRYSPSDSAANLKGLSIRADGATLLGGDLALAVHNEKDSPPQIETHGKLALDIAALAQQPAVAAALTTPLPAMPLTSALDFDLGLRGETINVRRGHLDLGIGERARVTLDAQPGLVLKTRLAAGEDLAQHFVGAAALDIKDLSSETLNRFVPLGPLSFAEINSSLRVRSNGKILRASTLAPLGVDAVRVNDGPRELLREFSLKSDASLRIEQHEIRASFKALALTFSAQPAAPALTGHIKAHIDPDKQVALTLFGAELNADLPQLLSQPAVMPGNKLKSGTLALRVAVDTDRKIAASAILDGLASDQPLAIKTFELPVTGEMSADGRGFDFTAPLIGRGKSGVTNATVIAHYAPQADELRVLNLELASEVFYLNDILATAQALKGGSAAVTTPGAVGAPVKIALNEKSDEKAAWKLVPPAVVIRLQIDKLFYTDYLAFTDVGGQLEARTHRLALHGIKAHFHDSSFKFEGLTRFDEKAPQPYSLDLTGDIKNFDLNQFFTELVPGEKPRVEGLFSIDVKAFGEFPNFSQLRNKVLFDMRMQSRDGLFRPLPPDSGLIIGASDVLGIVGESLSYVPTGGFGAGAIARLVNYIARIGYDTIDIHLLRDESRDVTIEQFQVLSPTIALIATGGIKHQDGSDIFDSPLELNAHLDMLGRGAAILYSMNLMQDTQNPLGYWRGPEFRIWGTAASAQSNLEEVLQQAADGTTTGSITRPIAGLIGNLKYRWFNRDSRKREALQRERRDEREEAAAKAKTNSTIDATATPAP